MTTTKRRIGSRTRKWLKRDIGSYLFLMPAILGFFIFTLYPLIMSLAYAFTDFNGMFATKVGVFNFTKIFDRSPSGLFDLVWGSFSTTFFYCLISTPLSLTLSFSLALFVFKSIRGVRLARTIYHLPGLIPGIALSLIWADMFAEQGIINSFLAMFKLPPGTFFLSEKTAIPTLMLTGLWGTGGGMIMWLAALNNIPPSLFEAAKIDGSGYMRTLFRLTIPMCAPMIFYNLIMSIIGGLQKFDSYAIAGAGPKNRLLFVVVHIYILAFQGARPQMGLASAIAWLLFAVIAVLTLATFKIVAKKIYYGEDG
jgi:multiple sugar transport system permease protein